MKTKNFKRIENGMTLVEALVALLVVICLAFIILPQLARVSSRASRISCGNNLRQVAIAFRFWANDNSNLYPWEVSVANGGAKELSFGPLAFTNFAVMQNELGQAPKVLVCPADTGRVAATNFIDFGNTNVSYFLGVTVHAADTNLDLFVAGDRSLIGSSPRHDGIYSLKTNDTLRWAAGLHQEGIYPAGYILFSDGNVQEWTTQELQEGARKPGVAPATLAFP